MWRSRMASRCSTLRRPEVRYSRAMQCDAMRCDAMYMCMCICMCMCMYSVWCGVGDVQCVFGGTHSVEICICTVPVFS